MQDLTAHYNILFNANELLRQKQEAYALGFIDSYGELLNVYQDTTFKSSKLDKDLDAAITKANTVINEKEQSHYIGDAYLVLGKANYLSGNYFNAAEFFNYVMRSFPNELKLVQEAAVWKARSLLYLYNFKEAKLVLDTAILSINPKKRIPADIFATKVQYDIDVQDYADGEEMAKKAVQYCRDTKQRLRLTFILGQLQELNHKNTDAIASYISITKSNASFEMSFNANLNRIRIEDERNGIKISRIDRLLSLLKNQNNKDFIDQIYYQVAEIYMLNKDINNAVKYYKLSVRTSKSNQNQKGLSYLRIADIDFKQKADYVNAKKYYDSTLTNLSPNYPGYQTIQKKSNNLQLLVDRLQLVAREDTLQLLAKLDEKTRLARIDVMVSNQILQLQNIADANALSQANALSNAQNSSVSVPNGSNFYFYNTNAISQGYADFKRRWGNRKLADDWRRSSQAATNPITNAPITAQNTDPDALPASQRKSRNDVAGGTFRQLLLQNLPLTPVLLAESNMRIYNAYLDIANFYRDVLEDKKEAIATYLTILSRFPNDQNKAAIYYSLYRLYSETDVARSEEYKNRLLKEYPESTFAKVIVDPDYSKNLDSKDAAFNALYNQVYDLYAQKKYTQVMSTIDGLVKNYPGNRLLAQLEYLRAIAAGHQEKVAPFQADLLQIAASHPDDGLITPLVKQHLAYVEANKAELDAQPYVLMNSDTTELTFIPPIVYKKETAYQRNRSYVAEPEKRVEIKQPAKVEPPKPAVASTPAPVVSKPVIAPPKAKPADSVKLAKVAPPVKDTIIKKDTTLLNNTANVIIPPAPVVKQVPSIFHENDSTNYFFVINVNIGTTDLSSSRFGVGQFDRANYPANAIRHQLRAVGTENQLIYVGRFYSMAEVKKYARGIIPLLPDIMKVPKDKYSFFIITQENLDKLADEKTLDSYYDYYQKTY